MDDTVTPTTIASSMLAFLRRQGCAPLDKDTPTSHTSGYINMDVVDAVVEGGGITSANLRRDSSPLAEENIIESPDLHVTQTQASSSNLVDILNVQVLPPPLSPKGPCTEGQAGEDNDVDVLEVPLSPAILPEMENTDMSVRNLADITHAHHDIPHVGIDHAGIHGLSRLDSVNVLVVDSHMQDDVRFVAGTRKRKRKEGAINGCDMSFLESNKRKMQNEDDEGRSQDGQSEQLQGIVIVSDTGKQNTTTI